MKISLFKFSILFITSLCISCGGGSHSTQPENIVTIPLETVISLPNVSQITLSNEISAKRAVTEMAIGINLGNTLDAPTEGEWALPAEEYYLQAFKDAGFKHVRIPVTWDKHIAQQPPYNIDNAFLDRVEQIVDWGLTKDLYVILNVHHDDWLKGDYQSISNRNRFDSIWIQVSDRFKEKPSRLIFEIFNEPHGLSVEQLNMLNKRTLKIIRNQTSNRLAIFSGNEWSNIDALLAIETPDQQDNFLIGNFHSYDPWNFAGNCTEKWGAESEKEQLKAIYQKAQNWSSTRNVPVMVNEFGVAKYDFEKPENTCNQSQREDYLDSHVNYATEFGVAATFWDDGGSFSSYDRATNTWGPEKDILVKNNE